MDETLLKSALEGLSELGTEAITTGLDHRSPTLRAKAIDLLSSRGALSLDTIERGKNDEAALVRLAALRASERFGHEFSLDEARAVLVRPKAMSGLFFMAAGTDTVGEALYDAYRKTRLRQLPLKSLRALLDSDANRHAAYLALAARRIDGFGDKLRNDLRDSFTTYVAKYWPGGEGLPKPRNALLAFGLSNPTETKRRLLVRQGLEILAEQREESDLALIRDVLDANQLNPSLNVVSFLKELGGVEDIERLGRVSSLLPMFDPDLTLDSSSTLEASVQAILRLSGDVLTRLLNLALPDIVLAKIVSLAPSQKFEQLPDASILRLLLTDKSQLRRAVAMKVPASLSRARVRRLLAAYRSDPEGRYYVVTHWLDLGLAYPRTVARRVASMTMASA
jgi:hypothetical protein